MDKTSTFLYKPRENETAGVGQKLGFDSKRYILRFFEENGSVTSAFQQTLLNEKPCFSRKYKFPCKAILRYKLFFPKKMTKRYVHYKQPSKVLKSTFGLCFGGTSYP